MKQILVIGSGGREHALCWKLAQSPQVSKIYCAPGNGGTAQEAKTENVNLKVSDFKGLIEFAKSHAIDLTVVGPDNPLADGIVDAFQAQGLRVFGPIQKAAKLESSKVFAKTFMEANHIPTARFEVFDDMAEALDFCQSHEWARVIKVDGLALGKGVYVCQALSECHQALSEIFESRRFGDSGGQIIIEERLYGPEISLMVLCDGKTMLPFTSSQDYKRRFEGNSGPNTGGMGAYSPVPFYPEIALKVEESVLKPLQKALQASDFVYQGVLFIGLLVNEGKPYVLEFNARFGDPETQCLLPRLKNDLYALFGACVDGQLSEHTLEWSSQVTAGVVLCAESYPEKGSSGQPISIEGPFEKALVFHAGTQLETDGAWVTSGGRILNIVGDGGDLREASQNAYKAIEHIHFPGMAFRNDIALEAQLCPSK